MKNYSEKDKKIIASFPEFAGIELNDIPLHYPKDDGKLDENPLLDVIYSIDERTKLPKGDIALFLSANTSPEIRQFISQNLHGEMPETPALPADSDIDFTRYMREKGEDRSSYLTRLSEVIREDKLKELELQKLQSDGTSKSE